MIKRLIFSFKKSSLLQKIANESCKKPLSSNELLNEAINNITQGNIMSKYELYMEQLLALLANDKYTSDLLTHHRKTFDDIRKIINKLERTGAGQIVKGHYVPVSSISFLGQLHLVLEHWDGENFKIGTLDAHNSNLKIAAHLIQSFE